MSGAEVLGVISSIVAIVDAAIKVYDAAQNTKGLPSSFLQAAARLPLLRDVLFTAQQGFDADKHWGTYASLERVLLHCKEKADALQKIFNDTMAAPEASRAERYWMAVCTLSRGRKVEDLVDSILADVQLLTASYAVKAATRAQVEDVIERIENHSTRPPRNRPTASIFNYGGGVQSIHTSVGDQNINTGSGYFFTGTVSAPFIFDDVSDVSHHQS